MERLPDGSIRWGNKRYADCVVCGADYQIGDFRILAIGYICPCRACNAMKDELYRGLRKERTA